MSDSRLVTTPANPWGVCCPECTVTYPCASCASQIAGEWAYACEQGHVALLMPAQREVTVAALMMLADDYSENPDGARWDVEDVHATIDALV